MINNFTQQFLQWYRHSDIRARRTFGIIFTYVLIGFVIGMYNFMVECPINPLEAPPFINVVLPEVLGGFLGGLGCSYVLLYFYADKFHKRSALYALVVQSLSVVVLITVVGFIASLVNNAIRLEVSLFSETAVQEGIGFVASPDFIRILLVWGVIVGLTHFYLMVADKYGPGQLWKIFMGHYRRPKETERIFMFLDIKDSTAWAERLGHHRYFEFLRDFFDFLAPAILKSNGEIYQYVGDEVVVSWRMDSGRYKDNAVQAFFSCQKAIQEKADHFIREYGAIPEFKAGMHAGRVMTGELGRIKKELVYSGVAISAASRIQHLCRQLQSDFLISEGLFHQLDLGQKVVYDKLGSFSLKGVEEQVSLIKIEKPSENWYFEAPKLKPAMPLKTLEMLRS